MKESNDVVGYLDKISQKISKAKGKKLINFEKIQKYPNEYILTFMELDGQNKCEITFKADNLEILKQDPTLNSVFYKRELSRVDWEKSLELSKLGNRKIS